jgi:recombinational DNA repair protein RecR
MAKITAKGLGSAIHHVVTLLEYVANAYGIPLCTHEDESRNSGYCLAQAHKELKRLANVLSEAIDDDICEKCGKCGNEKICPRCANEKTIKED